MTGCPPCRGFTPRLAAFYDMANEDGKQFEVVFVSSDDDADAARAYMDEMHGDWLRVPFDSPLRQALKQRYGCFAGKESAGFPGAERRSGIPALVVVGPGGEEREFDAKRVLERDPAGAMAQWAAHKWP